MYIHVPLNFNACSCAFNESSAVNTAPPVLVEVVLGVIRSVVPPFSPFSTAPTPAGGRGAERKSVVLELAWPARRARPISAMYICYYVLGYMLSVWCVRIHINVCIDSTIIITIIYYNYNYYYTIRGNIRCICMYAHVFMYIQTLFQSAYIVTAITTHKHMIIDLLNAF